MRIVFMGTPALAVPALEALRSEHEIVLAVTQPDKPAGRGHKLQASAVKEYALQQGIAVAQPERARDESFIAQLRELRPEAMAVVAYGQILPRAILEMPQENLPHGGCVNLHYSLLPCWRGAAPVQYSLWKGDSKTGVTTQWMAERLDAGDVILQREVPLTASQTAGELFEVLTPLGAEVLAETMRLMQRGEAPRVAQDEALATYAPTIKKDDVHLDWNQAASELANKIHAFNPRPTAQCIWNQSPLKVWRASAHESSPDITAGTVVEAKDKLLVATGEGALELLEVQPAGKPRMNALDWARGARLKAGHELE